MTDPRTPFLVPGRAILDEVRDAYAGAYRRSHQDAELAAVIVRFTTGPAADPTWAARMDASRISAEQKKRTFTALGIDTQLITLADTAPRARLGDLIDRANRDPQVIAVIVQSPPPPRMQSLLNTIDPAKDIDALGLHTTAPRSATADGILRVTAPFLDPDTRIGVIGARGFVGRGVVTGLEADGHIPVRLDLGDDLRALRDVDVVISATGRPGLVTPAYLHSGLRLAVDSGFLPTPDGPRGDITPEAAALPAAVTPVPGGIGPVEMAVLAERLTHAHAAPNLASWRYLGPTGSSDTATTAARDVAHHLEDHPQRGQGPAQAPNVGPAAPGAGLGP